MKKKKSKEVVSQDQWVVCFCPSVPDSNGRPHAVTPPSHHQSTTGWGGEQKCACVTCLSARAYFFSICEFHGHPLERAPAVCVTARPFFLHLLPKWQSVSHISTDWSFQVTITHWLSHYTHSDYYTGTFDKFSQFSLKVFFFLSVSIGIFF